MNRYRVSIWLDDGTGPDLFRTVVEAPTRYDAMFEGARASAKVPGNVVGWDVTPIDEHDPTPDRAASYMGLSLMAKAILFGGMLSW